MSEGTEQRVLLRMATARDAGMTAEVLARAGLTAEACADIETLLEALAAGAGALLIAEEALGAAEQQRLAEALAAQPPWSDIVLLLLARQGADSRRITGVMERLANVTVIERPVRVASLVSAVRSALRARARQYELRLLLDDLRLADRRKTEFLATLAHELRNPLAPIRTTLALMAQGAPDAAAQQEHLERIGRQVDHMVRLVDDLMEVSRITRGKVDLQFQPLRLDAVILDAIEQSRPLIDAAGHALSIDLGGEALPLRGDPVRLTQVFVNLLNNAAKYTPARGRIRIAASRAGDVAVIEVSDSGVGLAPEMVDSIFELFVQVSGTARIAQGGLGIGLTLVQSLVQLHGGSVAARSDGLGQGASFIVRLPLALAAAAEDADAPTGQQAAAIAGTVLVVDDNRDAADSLAALLEALGARTLTAYSGAEALREAAARMPDFALVDIGMPGMDGCELAGRLRALPGGPGLRLIALTGWGQDEDRRRVKAAGFDHHLLKPVETGQLLALLQSPAPR